jgi:hypothetical protein
MKRVVESTDINVVKTVINYPWLGMVYTTHLLLNLGDGLFSTTLPFFQMICQKLWQISVRVGITRSKVIFIITIDITTMISKY